MIPALEAAIDAAARMRDWQALCDAVDWLIAEQREFVAWWKARVRAAQRPKKLSQDADSFWTVAQAERQTKILKHQVSRWKTGLGRPDYRARLMKPSYRKGLADVAQNRAELHTGEMEWFTPALYVEKARRVLGAIDLDPASCAEAQKTIAAETFYTAADDGLQQRWRARVWLNPPYAGGVVSAFALKLLEEWQTGDVIAAVMLTNTYTDTSWWCSPLVSKADAVCFTRGRIKFELPYGEKCAPTNGQSFFYFGSELERLQTEFRRCSLILAKGPT